MEKSGSGPIANLRVIAMPPTVRFIRALLSAAVVVALVGCGATTATTSLSSPATTSVSSPTTTSATLSATSPTTSHPFICGASSAFPGTQAFINGVRIGTHAGYDRLTIEFYNGQPQIELSPQNSATFTPVGGRVGSPVRLAGQDGLLVSMYSTDAYTAYSGPTDFKTGYAGLLEVRVLDEYEGYTHLGLGLSKPACYRAVILTNPTRLVIDIQVT
jgi:hypothetical protein